MKIKRNVRKVAELGVVVTAIATLLMAGCGGGGGAAATSAAVVAVPVAGAGNSPFIGVTMKAECANGTTGTGVIGTTAAPGDGTINVTGTCTAPIKITATGKGKMRPIGAKADGSEDVSYSPDVNLPITNILTALPTTVAPATANPVTTLVANQFFSGVNIDSASSVAAAMAADGAASSVATAQSNVATSLGIPAAKINDDYRTAEIAAASTRLAGATAVAVQQIATKEIPLPADIGTRTLGQYMADKLAAASASLNNASGVTAQLGANLDAVANARVDRNAANVGNMVAQVELDAGTIAGLAAGVGLKPASVGDLLSQVVASSNVAVTMPLAEHVQEAKRNDVLNVVAQMATDARIAIAAASSGAPATEAQTRLEVAQAAAAQIKAGMDTALAGSAVDADVIAQYKLVANGVVTALASDLASSSPHLFAAPPTVGTAGVANILVGKLEGQVSSITAATPTDTATIGNYATAALKVAAVMDDLAPPPVVGGAVTTAQVVAYEATLAAMAYKTADSATSTTLPITGPEGLQARLDTMAADVTTKFSGTVVDTGVDLGALMQQAAVAALPLVDFAAPPAIGTVATVVAPSAPTFTTPSTVAVVAVTQAQIDAATAAKNQAVTYAATAATQATAAQTAASAAAAAATTAATSVTPAQTAAAAAQTAATAATAARVAADNAAAAAAAAFPGSAQASEAAAQATDAAASEAAALAANTAAKASVDTVTQRLMAAQLAAATTAAANAATAATTAATQATAAATAAASAVAATTAAAASPFATTAATAATAAQTAATTAATEAATAATQLPGSSQATAAATSATNAAASATAAKASSATAAARVTSLTASEAAASANATTAATTAAANAATAATTAATQAAAAAAAATSATAATTAAAATPFATAAATAATAAQTAATAAHTAAAAAQTALPGSSQATAAAASASAAAASATAAGTSSATAAARVATLTANEAAANAVCKVAVGSAVAYVSGYSCTATGPGSLSTNGGGATVTSVTTPAGVTPIAYSTLLTCDPFGAPPAAGATTLTPCKN